MSITPCTTKITSTIECYDAWSDTYDSDGNILLLIDDVAFEEIAQPLLHHSIYQEHTKPICCELGCGTGRITIKLLHARWFVNAVDQSICMMKKAQERVKQFGELYTSSISWINHDLNSDEKLLINDSSVDAVISTLVLEHMVSLDRFFKNIYRILKKNEYSWAFITSMHENMYRAGSQASVVIDKINGVKLCGISFDYSTKNIIEAATKANLLLIKYVEKGIENEEHAKNYGHRAKKWIGINIHVSFLFKIQI